MQAFVSKSVTFNKILWIIWLFKNMILIIIFFLKIVRGIIFSFYSSESFCLLSEVTLTLKCISLDTVLIVIWCLYLIHDNFYTKDVSFRKAILNSKTKSMFVSWLVKKIVDIHQQFWSLRFFLFSFFSSLLIWTLGACSDLAHRMKHHTN